MKRRIVVTDVYYTENHATAAALLLDDWGSAEPAAEYHTSVHGVDEYISGQFYQRELPHLLKVLALVPVYDIVVVDAHVWLAKGKPGLGHYLWKALKEKVPVIGVAKQSFHHGVAVPICRGESKTPLYITAVGMDIEKAKGCILNMAGNYRMPTMLKRVDQLSREAALLL